MNQRDALANRALAEIYAEHHRDDMQVAVVYGAAHVVGIVRNLSRTFRHRVVGAEWLDVYPFRCP